MRMDGGGDFKCRDHTGRIWDFRFFHRAKASESRITLTTQYLRRYLLRSGDTVVLHAPSGEGEPYQIEFEAAQPSHIPGEEQFEGHEEGAIRSVRVNQYERDPRNRKAAIDRHGVRCFGCRLELAEMYGEIARGYIHIHHIKPLSKGRVVKVDPEKDLVPLCPNCHAIVHLEDPPLTINRLKELIREAKE